MVSQQIFHSHEAVHATRAPCQPHPRSAGSSFHSFSTEKAFGCVCVLAEQGQCIGSHSRAPGLSWPMTYMWSLQKKCLKEICSSHVQQARLAQSAERKALNLVVVGSSPTVGVFCVASASPCRIQTELWLQLAMFAQSAFILQHIIEEQGLQAKIRFMVVCCLVLQQEGANFGYLRIRM